jgi:catalase
MKQPSTEWRERIAPDEEARFTRGAEVMARLQGSRSARFGPGRSLHRKQLMALSGTLDVLDGLPEHARHGLFARPGRHRVLVRLSNGSSDVQANFVPAVRGFALKVFDVSGEGAMDGSTDHQDFVMTNQDRFLTGESGEFIALAEASISGPLSAILHLFRAYGWGAFSRLRVLAAALGKKFDGFAVERFNTVVPICCGPYAVKARLKPIGSPPAAARARDIAEDMRQQLAAGNVAYDFELQFFVDEATTPIEDASKIWPDGETPIVTVARLTLTAPEAGAELAEAERFDPWRGLAAHRPLGDIMRARRLSYRASQMSRA